MYFSRERYRYDDDLKTKCRMIIVLDLDETPIWNNDIAILLSFWLQQRANHDDVFRRYAVIIINNSNPSFDLF